MKSIATIAALTLLLAGCAFMTKMMGGGADTTSINSADGRGDLDYLRAVCKGEKPARSEKDQKYACNRLEAKEGPGKALKADCSSVVEAYEKAGKPDLDYVTAMAKKMAECGHYEDVFLKVVHWGNRGEGAKVLRALEDDGLPVEQEWAKYLGEHTGRAFFNAERKNSVKFGLDHIGKWLLEKDRVQYCAATARAATGAKEWARVWVIPYLKAAGCKEGIPVMVSSLTSDTANHRKWACQALGKVGTRAELDKVKTLAETDTYNFVREEERNGRIWGVKVYPVREACLAAFGKIKLRN